jgi:hypothetical protein
MRQREAALAKARAKVARLERQLAEARQHVAALEETP